MFHMAPLFRHPSVYLYLLQLPTRRLLGKERDLERHETEWRVKQVALPKLQGEASGENQNLCSVVYRQTRN